MYHETINAALGFEKISMTDREVMEKIGSMNIEESRRFEQDGKQVCLYRMPSGRYEITAYKM